MNMCEDSELLRRYAAEKDEEAFAELVRRHLNLVYSAALRQVRQFHLAEDVTQTVFLKLARNAARLPREVVLAGWLHADTRLSALEALRKERRRAEREAIPMEASENRKDWEQIRPVIDEALSELAPGERDAVILRFFGGQSFTEVGATLRVPPDAARMRVNRALEKLRDVLESRGIKTTAGAVSVALLANAVQAAPKQIVNQVMASIAGSTAATTLKSLWFSKRTLMRGAVLAFTGVGIWFLWQNGSSHRANTVENRATAAGSIPKKSKEPSQPFAALPKAKTLELKVVDRKTGVSLENVEVKLYAVTDGRRSKSEVLQTSSNGTVLAAFPTEFDRDFFFRLSLSKDGYVPRFVSWSVSQHDDISDVPEAYIATMERGIEIGGFVRNSSNEPITGVKLTFSGPSLPGAAPRESDAFMNNGHAEVTDSNGHWQCNHVGSDFSSTILSLRHPLFSETSYGCKEGNRLIIGPVLLPSADFLSGRAEMRMIPGIIVSGMVINESDLPIQGARVIKDRRWYQKDTAQTTGTKGEFAFRDGHRGDLILTVEASGYAPETKTLRVEDRPINASFRLVPSVGLRGQVVDERGLPVADAEITIQEDESHQSPSGWSGKTDALGTYSWDSSPNEPIKLSVFAFGYSRTNVSVQPGTEGHVITIQSIAPNKPVTITIGAIDAISKHPINSFEVYYDAGSSMLQKGIDPVAGIYRFTSRDSKGQTVFEVRARGYSPARTKLLRFDEPHEIQVALNKSQSIAGTILKPDGERAVGADVVLCTEEMGAILATECRLIYTEQSILVRTDSNGRFEHAPLLDAHSIFVVAPSGFGKIRLSQWTNGEAIQLKPWGRISGIATINGEVVKNMELGLTCPNSNGNERSLTILSFNATADDTGHFVFENVPPMELTLGWMRARGEGSQLSHNMQIDIQPGGTTEVLYAPEGRTIRGNLRFEGKPDIDWSTQVEFATLGSKMGTPSYEKYRANPELMKKAYTAFWISEEGRDWERKRKDFALELRADGTFEIPAVPAGNYLLRVGLNAMKGSRLRGGAGFSMSENEVTVPEGDGEFVIGAVVLRGRR